MLAPQKVDLRIARLRKAFGQRVFSTVQASEVLRLPVDKTWQLLSYGDGLVDETSRVSPNSGDWWIVSVNPEMSMAARVAQQYSPILRTQETWSAQEFATAAAIPYPSANYVASLLVRFCRAEWILGGDRFVPPPIVIKRRRG